MALKRANGEGNLRKRSNGTWEARITVGVDPATGKLISKSVYARTQKEVRAKVKALQAKLEGHDNPTAALTQSAAVEPEPETEKEMTVGEWLDIWLADYLADVKPGTVEAYASTCRIYLKPTFGNIPLNSLKAPVIQKLYNQLKEKGLSPKYIKNIHGVLHKALKQAVLIGYLRTNPSEACILPRIIRKEMHPLEEDQVAVFLREVQGHPHEYLYKIALFTGLREGEVLGLGWEHIDFQTGTLTVKRQLRREQKKGGGYYFSPPKNNKSRCLTLAPSVIQLLRLQNLEQNSMRMEAGDAWEEHGLIFTNQTGGYLSYRTVYDCFKRIVRNIGAPATRFHDLRHTFAVASIKSGDDIKTVQENLGHATAAFTLDVYGHVTKQMKQDSAERMEQFIRSVSGA